MLPGRRECEMAGDIVRAQITGVDDIDTITLAVPNISSGQRIGAQYYNWYEGTLNIDD